MDEIDRKLATAEHELELYITGKSAAEFQDQNGEKIVYRNMNLTELKKYIEDLKNQKANKPQWPRPYTASF